VVPLSPSTTMCRLPRRRLYALLSLIPCLLICSVGSVHASQAPSHKLLDNKGFTSLVEVVGEPWVRRGGGLQMQGGGHEVRTLQHIATGDFEMRATLTFEEVESSGALFELGDNVFCFADRKGDSPLFVRGPDLRPKGENKLVLPGSNGRTPNKQRFEFTVRRDDTTLRILFDDEVLHSVEVGKGPLGRVGFQPRRSLLRITEWTLTGALMDPTRDGGGALLKLQPAINEAIDKGVDFLIEKQQRDGSWAHDGERYRNGQTALCMYTLLKCGVNPEHPAVQRARAFLLAAPPRETYALACQMMAFEATKDPSLKPAIGELLDQLLDWQKGGWSYPWDHAWENWHEKEGLVDLSNTQYAALGLRAAEFAGHEVPDRAWKRLLKDALNHQTSVQKVDAPKVEGRSSTGKREVAGFGYRIGREATGSMTTAGIAVVELCRKGLGSSASGSDQRKMDKSRQLAMNWLEIHFDVVENPGAADWVFYYLYGLERVGALLGLELIGSHPWYYEGAKRLVKVQRDNGSWVQRNEEADTCFALLFLERATFRGTGGDMQAPDDLYLAEDHDSDVRFRASGRGRFAVWLTGFSEEVREDHGVARGSRRELFLQSVEYWLDGALAERVACNPLSAWQGEGHAIRLDVPAAGDHRLEIRVTLALPEDADPLTQDAIVLEGDELPFTVDAGLEPWMLPIASASGSTLLADHGCEATASCEQDKNRVAEKAIDGLQSSAWLCKSDSGEKLLRLDFKKPLRAKTLVLQQAATRPQDRFSFDPITRVEIRFPGTKRPPLRADLPEDAFLPAHIALPADLSLRQLEIVVLETTDGGSADGLAGFAEVGFEVSDD
jgi:hypothetical protein